MWAAPSPRERSQFHGAIAAHRAHDEHSLRSPLPEAARTAACRSGLVLGLRIHLLPTATSVWVAPYTSHDRPHRDHSCDEAPSSSRTQSGLELGYHLACDHSQGPIPAPVSGTRC